MLNKATTVRTESCLRVNVDKIYYYWRVPPDRMMQIVIIGAVGMIDGVCYHIFYDINVIQSEQMLLGEIKDLLRSCKIAFETRSGTLDKLEEIKDEEHMLELLKTSMNYHTTDSFELINRLKKLFKIES
jgi:hypothetical protein